MRTLSALLGLALCLAVPGFAAAPPRPSSQADVLGDSLPKDAIARLGTARFRLAGAYYGGVALSPDGKLIAAVKQSAGAPVIALIDPTTGREIRSIPANTYGSRTMEFTADSKELLSASYDSIIRFFDVTQGKESRQVKVQPARAETFAVSADGSVLAATERAYGRKAALVVCEVKSGKQIASLDPIHTGQITLALSADGKYLATYGSSYSPKGDNRDAQQKIAQTVDLWDTAKGKEFKKIEIGIGTQVSGVAFSPDKKTVAVSTHGELQLWDYVAGKRLKSWRAPSRSGSGGLNFSHDGKLLVMAPRQGDAGVAVWDVTTGRRLPSARPPECILQGIGFRNGRVIALGLRSQALVVWDVLSGKRFDSDAGHHAPVSAIAFRKGRLYTAGGDRKVLSWDLSGKLVEAMPEPRQSDRYSRPSYLGQAIFSPDGGTLAANDDYSGVVLRDVASGEELFSFPRNNEGGSPAFSRDGKLVAVPAYDFSKRKSSVRVLRADSGEELINFDPGAGTTAGLAIDPSGKRLAVALASQNFNTPGSLLVWRIDTNKEDEAFKKFETANRSGYRGSLPLAFSPDGSLLAVSNGQAIQLLDAATGRERGTINPGGMVMLPLVFSPDGRSLAMVLSGNNATATAVVWELRTNKKRWEAALPATATALGFDPSGQTLVTAHQDTTVLLWDVSGRSQTGKVRDAGGWDALVKQLGDDDPAKAFAAQRSLRTEGGLAVEALRKRLKPASGKSLGEKDLAELVKQLDDDEQDVRRAAFDKLQEQGKAAEKALRKGLQGDPSAEVKRSINALLDKLSQGGNSAEANEAARAVEVLEWVGSPAARRLLTDLSAGRAGAPMTLEAKAALARLEK